MKNQIQIILEIFEKVINPQSVTLSAILTTGISGYSYLSDTSLFGVSILFILIVNSFMVVDWCLGVYASVITEGNRFKSNKLTYTIMKFITFYMWLFFINQSKKEYESIMWMYESILIIQIFVLILIGLREFVSIGENIERIWGQKPYLFSLIDSVFSILEKLFKKKLESKVDEIEDIVENNENEEL